MADDSNINKLAQEIAQAFGLSNLPLLSKQDIIDALTARIEQLIDGNPEQLFSLLYRLDIAEKNIKKAMLEDVKFSTMIAELIYIRQEQKARSRKIHKSQTPPDDLAW